MLVNLMPMRRGVVVICLLDGAAVMGSETS